MGGEPAFELLLLLDQHLVVIVFVLYLALVTTVAFTVVVVKVFCFRGRISFMGEQQESTLILCCI